MAMLEDQIVAAREVLEIVRADKKEAEMQGIMRLAQASFGVVAQQLILRVEWIESANIPVLVLSDEPDIVLSRGGAASWRLGRKSNFRYFRVPPEISIVNQRIAGAALVVALDDALHQQPLSIEKV